MSRVNEPYRAVPGPAAAVVASEATGETLGARDFAAFRQLIYEAAGIHLSDHKIPMLSNRLRRRMRSLRLGTYRDYYNYLLQAGSDSAEFFRFLEVVTTNETYFFRNRPLWDAFQGQILPTLLQRTGPGEPLRFWCAASSSGEEPYTLAIVLHGNRANLAGRAVRILASDISEQQLATARAARYDSYSISRLRQPEQQQYFLRQGEQYQLREEYRRYVEFFFHNLKTPMLRGPVDCIIIRNVLMYFDRAMQEQVLLHASAALHTGGFLIVGDVDPFRTQFELLECLGLRSVRTWVYEKIG